MAGNPVFVLMLRIRLEKVERTLSSIRRKSQKRGGFTTMVGMMQIMIWLLCVYLVFKGIEIFQIAYVSPRDGASRGTGITLGVVMIIVAVIVSIIFFVMEESIAAKIGESQRNIPGFNP